MTERTNKQRVGSAYSMSQRREDGGKKAGGDIREELVAHDRLCLLVSQALEITSKGMAALKRDRVTEWQLEKPCRWGLLLQGNIISEKGARPLSECRRLPFFCLSHKTFTKMPPKKFLLKGRCGDITHEAVTRESRIMARSVSSSGIPRTDSLAALRKYFSIAGTRMGS